MGYNVLSKSCKRCGGDLFLEWGASDLHYECIQCSATDERYTQLIRTKLLITGVAFKEKIKDVDASLFTVQPGHQ